MPSLPVIPPADTGPTSGGGGASGKMVSARTIHQAASADAAPARSLYVHVPFCVHKCHYCDFYSFVDTRDQQPAFVDRLVRELAAVVHRAGPLRTIFVGGGTPSLLRVDLWRRLLTTLNERFDLSLIKARSADTEFTVECNPESTTPELLDVLVAGGVSRISVGAQSFDPRHLKTLERWHEPANVARALHAARAAGIERRSLDLIFAVPGQTLAEWEADLRAALGLGTTHLSCYALTYEPNTAMTVRLRQGEFEPVDEDTETAMFTRTVDVLRAAGLNRYEVSNFAIPGHESRHNLAYWRQEPWLACGPSASGHLWAGPMPRAGGHRWKNVPRLPDYLAFDDAGYAPIVDHEPPEPRRALRERIMTGLRLAEGLDAAALQADAEALAPGAGARLSIAVRAAQDQGHVHADTGGRWTLTDQGFLLADGLAAKLMACVAD